MTELQKRLFELSDSKYAAFQVKLTPGISKEEIMGVRMPVLRAFAKEFEKEPECEKFLHTLPHAYYDENMLHSVLLSGIKPYEKAVRHVYDFLPYVNNWAVCDSLGPKIFSKHKTELLNEISVWIKSDRTYTCRFAVDMLMTHYLGEDFDVKYNDAVSRINSDEYYVKMMVAWYFATALAKQWELTLPYIERRALPEWTHRKAIQKALESYRITDEHKAHLRTLR